MPTGLYPKAEWIGSPNVGYPTGTHGRGLYTVRALVLHIAEGTLDGCDSWFQVSAPQGDPSRAVSAHFCVGRHGEVHQYVDVDDAAWHAGIVEAGNWLPDDWPRRVNPNLLTVGIEHEGYSGARLPIQQVAASLELAGWLCRRFLLAPDLRTILPHQAIAPITRAACPGSTFPLIPYISILANAAQ